MAIAVGGSIGSTATGTGSNGNTATHSTTNTVPSGALIVCGVSFYDGFGPGSSLTFAGGSLSWTTDKRLNAVSGDTLRSCAIVSAPAPSGLASATTLTATYGANCFSRSICGVYLTGQAAASYVDATGGGGTAGTSLSAALTTTNADDCIIAFGWEDGVAGSSTPLTNYVEQFDYTNTFDNNTYTMVSRIVAATSAYTPGATIAGGSGWVMAAVAYKAAAGGGGGTVVKNLAALGVG